MLCGIGGENDYDFSMSAMIRSESAAVAHETHKVPQFCYQCVTGPVLLTIKVEGGVATEVEPNFAAAEVHPGAGNLGGHKGVLINAKKAQSMNSLIPMSMALTDSTVSSTDIVRVGVRKPGAVK